MRISLTIFQSGTSFWKRLVSREAYLVREIRDTNDEIRLWANSFMVTRKFKRFPVSMPSTLVDKDRSRHKGAIRDLSARGCRLESLIKTFTGMQVSLLLHAPGELHPITIENAAIRWCGPQGIGMEFLIVAQPDQDRLCRIVQQLEARAGSH